jgi:hypothetical protein
MLEGATPGVTEAMPFPRLIGQKREPPPLMAPAQFTHTTHPLPFSSATPTDENPNPTAYGYCRRKNTAGFAGLIGMLTALVVVLPGTVIQLVLKPTPSTLVCVCKLQPV